MNRFGRAGQHRDQSDGERIDALLSERADRERAGALRHLLTGERGDEVMVRKPWRFRPKRLEQLDLHCGVRDMILPPENIRRFHVNVVDHRGESIEEGAVGAHQHGVRER